jgi:two-component system NtrC family sensor kinase
MSTKSFAFRRATVMLAFAWALFALVAFMGATMRRDGYMTPFYTTMLFGRVTVSWVSQPAAEAGIGIGDRIVTVDGVPYIDWSRSRRWQDMQPGRTNNYAFETKDGIRHEARLEPVPIAAGPALSLPIYAACLVVGGAFLLIGALVWMLRPGRDESWAFALLCSAIGSQLFLSFETQRQMFEQLRSTANIGFCAAASFHLFTTYPFQPPWIARRPRLRAVPYVLAVLAYPVSKGLHALGVSAAAIEAGVFATMIATVVLSCGLFAWERHRRRGDDGVERADAMLLGALVSFLPVIALIVTEAFLQTGFPVYIGLLWFVVFPICVAYGIVRKQLFDIRHVMRSSAVYGAATLAITGFYALLVASADAALVRFHMNARSPWFSVCFLFFAILAVNPLRNWLQTMVDRLFDRDRGRDRQTVREVSEAMVSMLSIQEIVERIVRALSDSMGIERSMVLLHSDEDSALRAEAWSGTFATDPRHFSLSTEHPACKYLWMRRQEVSRGDLENENDAVMRAGCQELFDQLDVVLLVPVLFGVDLLGLVAVGRKHSGERLSADDRQLLLTLANQSSIAIENAKAFDEIAKLNETLEARVDERTQELRATQAQLMQSEKMRTLGQLVAGVAHELNNPIGFVHANLKLLDEYVAKLARQQEQGDDTGKTRDAIQKLLARSREGTERVTKIVADLRAFSRMDQGELAEADLNDEIERTLTLMEPRCKNCIEVTRDFGTLPPVRCHAGQLNQAFLNLLMNACDAIGDTGRIAVRTRAENGHVRLEFEDSGPGIPRDVRDRVFEPFFTTKPVGKGTGLGLSLTHGIIERHGGRIWVESEEGRGTRFLIELPIEGVPASALAS